MDNSIPEKTKNKKMPWKTKFQVHQWRHPKSKNLLGRNQTKLERKYELAYKRTKLQHTLRRWNGPTKTSANSSKKVLLEIGTKDEPMTEPPPLIYTPTPNFNLNLFVEH